MPWCVHETHGSKKTSGPRAFWAGRICRVAFRFGTILAFVERCVGVANLDRDTPPQLLAMSAGPDSCYRLNQRGLPMIYVSTGTDVHYRLGRDPFLFSGRFLERGRSQSC